VLSVGVVGCGYWGSKHVRVLSGLEEVGQVAAIDPRPERLAALQRSFPSLLCFSTLDEALGDLDAVVIATPPVTHASLGCRALEAGLGVLIEKPLATSTDHVLQLMEAAALRSAVLMVGHTFEYNSAVWKLRELIETGELGNLYYLHSARLNLGLYQSDVNVIWDLAPHDVSIMNYVLGERPSTVHAWGASHAHSVLEDVAYLRLHYSRLGVMANIHVSWLDPLKTRRLTVVGSSKMAVYDDLSSDERVRIYDKGVVLPTEGQSLEQIPMSYRYGEIRSPYITFEEPLTVQDRHFVACVADGSVPRTDATKGYAVVQVLEAAMQSIREGGPVHLDNGQVQRSAALTSDGLVGAEL
jgi:predicted dehydrogenase